MQKKQNAETKTIISDIKEIRKEVEELKGEPGDYTVSLRQKATYVDWNKCTGCG